MSSIYKKNINTRNSAAPAVISLHRSPPGAMYNASKRKYSPLGYSSSRNASWELKLLEWKHMYGRQSLAS